jgi:hypothetical protein
MKEAVYLDKTYLIVGLVIVVLFGAGILSFSNGTLFLQGNELFSLGTGTQPENMTTVTTTIITTTTTTVTTTLDADQSTLSMGTGYVDGEGNWVTPTAAAQESVFYGGTAIVVVSLRLQV